MNEAVANARILMIEETIRNHADVLSAGQIEGMRATIAKLRATIAGKVEEMPRRKPKSDVLANELPATEPAAVETFSDADLDAIEPPPLTRDFVTAGKAIFTFASPKGGHFTFKVERPDDFKGEYFGHVMTGTSNESDYAYVGMVNGSTMRLRETKGSKFKADSREFAVFSIALDVVAGRKTLPDGYKLHHCRMCGRCGLRLSTPESIRKGYGPECSRKLGIGKTAAA